MSTMSHGVGSCAGTVLYAFLARDALPLWQVWEAYWDGCPMNSYAIAVHTQNASLFKKAHRKALDRVSLVPTNGTVHGELRFDYRMVQATFALYRQRHALPGGCRPRWIQLLSDACAPVVPCAIVHKELARSQATRADKGLPRYAGTYAVNETLRVQHHLPTAFKTMVKTSQWITISSAAADLLLADRRAIAHRWASIGQKLVKGHGAIDEWLWWQELQLHGQQLQPPGLMYSSFSSRRRLSTSLPGGQQKKRGHAASANTTKGVFAICMQARAEHRFFARKFGPSVPQLALNALIACAQSPLESGNWSMYDSRPVSIEQIYEQRLAIPLRYSLEHWHSLRYSLEHAQRDLHSFVPKHHLLLCRIEEAATSMLADMMCSLAHQNSGRNQEHVHRKSGVADFERGCKRSKMRPAQTPLHLAEQPNVKTYAFVREPLERFLSAYLSKCAPNATDGDGRHICRGAFAKFPITFPEAVRALGDNSFCPSARDPSCNHFIPQAYLCGYLPPRAHIFQLGHTEVEVASQVRAMLSQVGVDATRVPAFQRHFPQSSQSSSRPDTHASRPARVDAHTTGSYSLVKHYYNTDEQIIAVLRYYSLDYVRFNISVPTWAARRIGETAALLLAELHPHR